MDTQSSRQQPPNILYIEDNENDFVLVQAYLPHQFIISWCPTAEQARYDLEKADFDLVLLDHGLPDTNSLSFLEELRQERPHLPVIILTGYEDQALAVSAMKKGAASYLLKDEIADHLLPIIEETLNIQHTAPPIPTPQLVGSRFLDTAEHIYKVLLETMNEGCLVVTSKGLIIFANEALGHLYGANANTLLGLAAIDIFAADSKPKLAAIFNTSYSDDQQNSWSFEGHLRTIGGPPLPVLISCRKTMADEQTAAGYLFVLTNIIESVEARQKLDDLYHREKKRNQKLQLLLKIATETSGLNVNSLITLVCRHIGQEMGYYRVTVGTVNEDVIYVQPQHQFFHGKRPPHINQTVASLDLRLVSIMTTAVNEQRTIYEPDTSQSHLYLPQPGVDNIQSELAIPILSNQKTIAVLDVQSEHIDGLDKDDILILSLMADHLAKALENARLYQEGVNERQRLRALINSSRDGIIFITAASTMPVINSQAIALLQLPGDPNTWHNRSVYAMLEQLKQQAPYFVLMALTELQRIQEGHITPQRGEIKIQATTIEWQNLPVSADDVSLGWLMVLRDVTQEQRARELQQDLTRTMVHDLRTPLTGILSSLQVLRRLDDADRDKLTARQRRSLDLAMIGSGKMLTLVNDILDVSQLESGEIPLQEEAVYIHDLVDSTLHTHTSLATDKAITINNKIANTLPAVWVDPHMIERVLQNLLDNAIKFTPPNGRISLTSHQNTPTHIQVTVTDNGPGIGLEIQSRLFHKFVTGNQVERGSGLGLAFCKLVIEAHNGHIWAEDSNPLGATFHFTLPIAD